MASWPCFRGTLERESEGRFGFIKQDTGGDDLFVMPTECVGFGRALPPVGTRVMYTIGRDPMKGEPRAEDVIPEDDMMQQLLGMMNQDQSQQEQQGQLGQLGQPPVIPLPDVGAAAPAAPPGLQQQPAAAPAMPLPPGVHAGTVKRNNGRFGFILQDSDQQDMFLMPVQCQAFGGMLPPVGTRVVYMVGADNKTGKPRAEEVQPEEAFLAGISCPTPRGPRLERKTTPRTGPPLEAGTYSGVIKQNAGRYGFILQDGSEADMFFMPIQCQAFGGVCPRVGTRVIYEVGQDVKSGKPRAENIRPEDPDAAGGWVQARKTGAAGDSGPATGCTGVVKLNSGNFGFILQDSGENDMFLMPAQCLEFGGTIPPVGTRVTYDIAADPKTGKLRAENVAHEGSDDLSLLPGAAAAAAAGLPGGCMALAAAFAAAAGKPMPNPPVGAERTGLVKQNAGRFGFILPDGGEEADMFVMPLQCTGFGGQCPPVGTRVIYKVGQDPKSGRSRAEEVRPEDPFRWQPTGEFNDYANNPAIAAAACAAAAQAAVDSHAAMAALAAGIEGYGPAARLSRDGDHASAPY